jgi:altronate hydrolase
MVIKQQDDPVSITALTVAGAQIILFTTGRGNPLGSPVPTIKISTNSELYKKKNNWIDFNAGQLIDGVDMNKLAEDLMVYILKVASGKVRTKNEINNYRDIGIFKKGVTL